uniref:Uncharacterized protein n=1 Tax=Anguilla anguilla TaxID=7936 RepID=A0A0E9UDS1_ANGAN
MLSMQACYCSYTGLVIPSKGKLIPVEVDCTVDTVKSERYGCATTYHCWETEKH